MDPLVSIIVPVYNVEEELSECIESIINQTYEKIEVILVDDGSTDRSGEICEEYQKKDQRIKAYHKENSGISEARNYGIEHSNGEYIACVDSDDYIKKTMISSLVSLVLQNEAQIAVSPYQKFSDKSQLFEETVVETGAVDSKEALIQLLYQNRVFHTGAHCKLYLRNLFEGIRYPAGISYAEDLGTTYKLIIKSARIAYTTEKLYGYRIREQSMMRQDFSEKKMACIPISKKLYSDICDIYPDIRDAVAVRAFNVNRAVYLQIPYSMKEERDLVWAEMKRYRKLVLINKKARILDRVMALCSYLGKSFFMIFAIPYRKQQMGLK